VIFQKVSKGYFNSGGMGYRAGMHLQVDKVGDRKDAWHLHDVHEEDVHVKVTRETLHSEHETIDGITAGKPTKDMKSY